MSHPWRYIKLSELMSSVKSDLSLFDDSGFIDEDRVIKVIAECNEKLGQRIYKSRECKITVKDYKADIPKDLYKIENLLATCVINISNIGQNHHLQARQLEFLSEKPKDTTKLITYGKMGCQNSCNECYWIEDRRPATTELQILTEKLIPLQLSNSLYNRCTEYSPCINNTQNYKIDLEDDLFKLSFEKGEIYLCYLGNLVSDEGEIQIPFHPMLNSYYEYAVKEKVLEDMFLNSDMDILNKLKYISQKKRDAYVVAWDFANTREVNEWNKIQKKLQQQYYNKWYQIFN